MSYAKIRILYMEDIQGILDIWLEFIRKNWGEDCMGARSREKALQLIREGFEPDLVIFDRGILLYENEQVDDRSAGDRLYYDLVEYFDRGDGRKQIPVAVISGDDLEDVEPYCSHPPLGFFGKPVGAEALRRAVDLYQEWLREVQ